MSYIYSNFIVPAAVVFPLSIGITQFKAIDISYRFLIGFLTFSLIGSVLGKLSAYFFHTNILINELYTLGEFPLVAAFYYFQSPSIKIRRLILSTIIAFIVLCVGLMIVFNNVNRFDDYSSSTESLLLIFLGLNLINSRSHFMTSSIQWKDEPVNWFNTGILLYFSGSLFIFLLFNYFLYTPSILDIVWDVHATFFLLLNVLFVIGFYKVKTGPVVVSKS